MSDIWEPVSYAPQGAPDSLGPTIDKVYQRDGSALWAVRRGRSCLNKLGKWEYEPSPSNREDDFIERCRYATLEAAMAAYERATGKT